MQVSTAILRAANTRYRHTDRVSGDTVASKITIAGKREGGEGAKVLNRPEGHSRKNCMFSHSWQAKQVSPAKPRVVVRPH